MTTQGKTFFGILIIIILGIGAYWVTRPESAAEPEANSEESILGCYVDSFNNDVYTLKVDSRNGENFSGSLDFDNFEKDSSSGTYTGTYKEGILLGDYVFQSEGMESEMQVIFKKTSEGFVRGYGDTLPNSNDFADLGAIVYDETRVFKASPECGTVSSKLPEGSTVPGNPEDIQGVTWKWNKTVMNDGTVISPKKAGAFTLTMDSEGKASGNTDCNSYFASYQIGSDGVIEFGTIGSTKMFCEGSQEAVFTGELSQVSHYMLDSKGNLVLLLPFDSGSILFTK